MATATFPRPVRRPANALASGRAQFLEIHFWKPIDNSALVRDESPTRRHDLLVLLGVGVLLFSVLMLFTMEHLQSLEARYQIESLKTQSAQLEESNARLRRDQADLTKPQRLEKLAIQYGMVRASAKQVITWGQGEAVPLPEP